MVTNEIYSLISRNLYERILFMIQSKFAKIKTKTKTKTKRNVKIKMPQFGNSTRVIWQYIKENHQIILIDRKCF